MESQVGRRLSTAGRAITRVIPAETARASATPGLASVKPLALTIRGMAAARPMRVYRTVLIVRLVLFFTGALLGALLSYRPQLDYSGVLSGLGSLEPSPL